MEEPFLNNKRIGLINRGNTCFLNTILQLLFHIDPITQYIISNQYVIDINNEKRYQEINRKLNAELKDEMNKNEMDAIKYYRTVMEYAKIIKAMYNSENTRPLEPRSFHQCIQHSDDRFNNFDQHDAEEFLIYLLDSLNEGLTYEMELSIKGTIQNSMDKTMKTILEEWKKILNGKYSIIIDVFNGMFCNIIYDENNKEISHKYDIFNNLNIEIVGDTLIESLDNFFKIEQLESKYFYEKKNLHIDAFRKIQLVKLPQYFIIVLKRFKTVSNSYMTKINKHIDIPIERLNLSKYTEGYDKFDADYELVSIGCHSGGLTGGHYFAFCRLTNNQWCIFNDGHYQEIDIQNYSDKINFLAYILIYKKK